MPHVLKPYNIRMNPKWGGLSRPSRQSEDQQSDVKQEEKGPEPIEVPNDFLCPITKNIMRDPVVCSADSEPGRKNYERDALLATGIPKRSVVRNYALKNHIEDYFKNPKKYNPVARSDSRRRLTGQSTIDRLIRGTRDRT